MDGAAIRSRLTDGLVTILAVWAILIGTGMAFGRWQPHIVTALVSFMACAALLFAWGRWTAPGRRMPLPVYLLAGLLYILLTVVLALAVPIGAVDVALWLSAGFAIGFQVAGGPDAPLEYYLLPMVLNLFGPILVMGLLRNLARRDGDA